MFHGILLIYIINNILVSYFANVNSKFYNNIVCNLIILDTVNVKIMYQILGFKNKII